MLVLLRSFKNIFLIPDLRQKVFYVFGVLAVFRFGMHVPLPGINTVMLKQFMSTSLVGGLFNYLQLVSGGALQQAAIFGLAMSPYITASIMMQLLTIMTPTLEALAKEGEHGRRIINQYTRYLALGLSLVQGFAFVAVLERQEGLILEPGWGFRLTSILMLSVGSMFVMWLGEQISAHGLGGSGSSFIIFASIVCNLPGAILKLINSVSLGQMSPILALFIVFFTAVIISCIVFLERGERRIPVQYAKRIVGHKVYGGVTSYIPFKLNSAGVVPIIFAGTILTMPMLLINALASKYPSFLWLSEFFAYGGLVNNLITIGLIIFFAFVYTAIIFNPVELAENIRKSGGYIPGIHPGKKTAAFFDYVLTRVGFPGAVYLATLAILPRVVSSVFTFPVAIEGISLLITVGVALDLSSQLESTLIERNYEGFLATGKRLKGRNG